MTHVDETPLDKNLRKLQRSTGFFSILMVAVLSIVFASSIWTNYKVIALTTGLKHNQERLAFVQRQDAYTACNGENEVRTEFLTFIDDTVSRSELSTQATIASPTASLAQKAAAQLNLKAIRSVDADLHKRAAPKTCIQP